jgi:hypothetical protein
MRGQNTSLRAILSMKEQGLSERRLRSGTTPLSLALLSLARRCRAIPGAADGFALVEVARLVEVT